MSRTHVSFPGVLSVAVAALLLAVIYAHGSRRAEASSAAQAQQARPHDFSAARLDRGPDDQLADQRRQPVQPAVLTPQDDQPHERDAAQRRVACASRWLRDRAPVLGLRRADCLRRHRVYQHRRERRVRGVARRRRRPSGGTTRSSIRTSPPSAAAGTTRASRSARTRCSSDSSMASSSPSIARRARSRGRFRPSAGRRTSRSRRRRCT